MTTEAKVCNFEKKPVTFLLSKDNGVMVNATEMAKIFGKEVARFMENDSTKNFINSCLKTRNSSFLNVKNVEDLYTSKQKSGTFMHRILALKFAAWLDPDFEVWVYSTIEEIHLACKENNCQIVCLKPIAPNLEDVFISLTQKTRSIN